jgi:hypothetical protein
VSEGPPHGFEDWLRSLLTDTAFWPVLFTVGAIAVTLLGWLLASAVTRRSMPAVAAVVLLLIPTADALQRDLRRRRFGLLSRLVVGLWAASAAAAAVGSRFGFL